MNSVNFTGNVGGEPKFKDINDNLEIMEFSIFVKTYKKGDPNNGFWLNVTHFKPNDYLKDLVHKGVPVAISGRLEINTHDKKTYTKCITNDINPFPKAAAGGDSEPTESVKEGPSSFDDGDDDIPF